ncbi:MAG TPA: hypothetical protein VH599_02065 [Ktedonobacterales bacterium]|jgi:hypothetical protein
MRSIRDGLLAGALSGLLLVTLLFFDEGPGNQLILVAQSLGLDGRTGSKWVATLVIFVLGAIIGGLFGALQRQPSASRGWALLWGLIVGVVWWAVLFVVVGGIAQRLPFSFYTLLLYLVLWLVYGLVLASAYTTMRQKGAGQPA